MSAAETLITEHLDTWTSAIKAKSSAGRGSGKKQEFYGLKKLRELILEIAVRGLLVPQDPDDAPASELLKTVARERSDLVKAGKLKKQAALPPIDEASQQYPIPKSWLWARIGTLGNVFNGDSISAQIKEAKYTGVKGRPFIATKDVGYGFERLDYENGVAIPEDAEKFQIARIGAALICAEGGSAGKKCGITERDICFGNKLFANELFGGISSKFILSVYLSPTFFAAFSDSMTGIIGGISKSKFETLLCPLPPLAEQHRIVAKVDELMALCDKLEQQQEVSTRTHATLVETLLGALTAASERGAFGEAWQRIASHFDTLFTTESSIDQLKQTILQLAVMGKLVEQEAGDEPSARLVKRLRSAVADAGKTPKSQPLIDTERLTFSLPSSWEWVQAQELCRPNNLITYGILKPIWVESGVPTVRVQDMKNGEIDESDLGQCSPERAAKFTKTTLEAGDLLIAKDGATLGKTGFVPATLAGGNITQHVLRFPISDLVDRVYIRLVIDSSHGQEWMKGETKGVALPGVNVGDFRRMPIPLPSPAEQYRIVAKVAELMALCDRLKASLQTAQATQLHLADSLVEAAIH